MATKIIIVDDQEPMRKVIRGILRQIQSQFSIDMEIEEAKNGKEALEKISEKEYSVVLLDIVMPDMSGIEVLKKIRETKKDLPIIMVTAETSKEKVIEAIKSGATDYITKPFTGETLLKKIQRFLK